MADHFPKCSHEFESTNNFLKKNLLCLRIVEFLYTKKKRLKQEDFILLSFLFTLLFTTQRKLEIKKVWF